MIARALELEKALREVLTNRDGQIVHRAALERAQKALDGSTVNDYREALLLQGFRSLKEGHKQTVLDFVAELPKAAR